MAPAEAPAGPAPQGAEDELLGRRHRGRDVGPGASEAAMAADREQPVPWLLAGVHVAAGQDGDRRAVEQHVGHLVGGRHPGWDSTPGRWPPLTSTQVGPSSWMRRAMSTMASTSSSPVGARSGQQGRLPQVGRGDQGVGQQVAPVGVDALLVQEDPPGGGHHDRVHHQVGEVAGGGPAPDDLDDPAGAEQSGLDRPHRQVVEDGGDLGLDQRRGQVVDLADGRPCSGPSPR